MSRVRMSRFASWKDYAGSWMEKDAGREEGVSRRPVMEKAISPVLGTFAACLGSGSRQKSWSKAGTCI